MQVLAIVSDAGIVGQLPAGLTDARRGCRSSPEGQEREVVTVLGEGGWETPDSIRLLPAPGVRRLCRGDAPASLFWVVALGLVSPGIPATVFCLNRTVREIVGCAPEGGRGHLERSWAGCGF